MKSYCVINGCTKPIHSLNLCQMHYRRLKRWNNPYTGSFEKRKPAQNSSSPRYILPGNRPRELWLAWAAGFIDGEGTLNLSKSSAKTLYNFVRIIAVNRDKTSLEYLQALFGGGIRQKTRSKNTPAHHSDTFYWQATGRRAANAIKDMLPFFVIKKRHAEILIEFDDNKPFVGRGHPLPPEEWERRDFLRHKLNILNKRGKPD